MALTVSISGPLHNIAGVYGGMQQKVVLLLGDAAYPQGGYAVTPGTFGFLNEIVQVTVPSENVVPGAYVPYFDGSYETLRFMQVPATPTGPYNEAVTGTNLSVVQITALAQGW
jgi:hypothetical protein